MFSGHCFLLYTASLVGCQELLSDIPQSPGPLVREGGSEAVQASAARSHSCVARSPPPCRTADELALPLVSHRRCHKRTRDKLHWGPQLWLEVKINKVINGGGWGITLMSILYVSLRDTTYSLIVSLLFVQTTQSMGRTVDRKWDFWTVLLRMGAGSGPGVVTSIIRRRFTTLWQVQWQKYKGYVWAVWKCLSSRYVVVDKCTTVFSSSNTSDPLLSTANISHLS